MPPAKTMKSTALETLLANRARLLAIRVQQADDQVALARSRLTRCEEAALLARGAMNNNAATRTEVAKQIAAEQEVEAAAALAIERAAAAPQAAPSAPAAG